jgi:hypothetical protein
MLLRVCSLKCVIREVQENQTGYKLYGTHQLLFCGDDVHLLRNNINTTEKNKVAVIYATKALAYKQILIKQIMSVVQG